MPVTNKVTTLTIKHGGKAKKGRHRVDEILIKDKDEGESYIIGEEAVPFRTHTFGVFPKRDRIFFMLERIADTIPLQIQDTEPKRTTTEESYEIEDMELYKEVQKAQAGDQEPEWSRYTGMAIFVLAVIAGLLGIAWFLIGRGYW